jgi:hypothetical protein
VKLYTCTYRGNPGPFLASSILQPQQIFNEF